MILTLHLVYLELSFTYSNGKMFCLHGEQKHRSVKMSRFEHHSEPDCYIYTENSSKKRSGGFADLKTKNPYMLVMMLVMDATCPGT